MTPEACALRLPAIALQLHAIALRLPAIALQLHAIALRLHAIVLRLPAISVRLPAFFACCRERLSTGAECVRRAARPPAPRARRSLRRDRHADRSDSATVFRVEVISRADASSACCSRRYGRTHAGRRSPRGRRRSRHPPLSAGIGAWFGLVTSNVLCGTKTQDVENDSRKCNAGLTGLTRPGLTLEFPERCWPHAVHLHEPAVHCRSRSEPAARGDLLDGQGRPSQQPRGVLALSLSEEVMQRLTEDLRRHPADVLRRQVERPREVFPARRLLLPVAIPQEVLCRTNEALPMPGRERPRVLLWSGPHLLRSLEG
jgi:hypothetical protein